MKKFKSKIQRAATLIFLLVFSGCYVFDFVSQPYTADPDSFFNVQISVTSTDVGSGLTYFGILLPTGWTTADSIEYISVTTNDTGFMVYSDNLTQQMSSIDPPPGNYYWWVGVDYISTSNIFNITFMSDFKIYTDSQTGNFFLDYMLGDAHNGF